MPGTWNKSPVSRMVDCPSITRYGYRTLDRQWVIADQRFLDRASAAWSLHSERQIYLTWGERPQVHPARSSVSAAP